jgi:formate hydrogenlyase subunit 6/NADH:ubiquinone oxidoreductase subunit I
MERKDAGTIAKTELATWVESLLEQGEVLAPTAGHGGDVLFAPVAAARQVLWEFDNPLYPPKATLLPQTDALLAIRHDANGYTLEASDDERPRVLLNVRSCDATGIAFLARVHGADVPDARVVRRAADFTVITLACTVPCRDGFCICCDAGPFGRTGFDLQLTDLGDRLFAEPGSDRGRDILLATGTLFRPATEAEAARRVELEELARGAFGERRAHFASAMRRISTGRVADSLWEEMEPWCLECGGCTYVCPTCYCFSVKDRRDGDGFLRCRIWDSCQYAAFTLEASGHNPRERRKERMKRRFFHKVSAQYFKRDGMLGCVGCGRCIRVCLGTTNMPAVVAAIRRGNWNG